MAHELRRWAERSAVETESINKQLADGAGCYFETGPDGRKILRCKPLDGDYSDVFNIDRDAKGQGVEQIDTLSDEARAILRGWDDDYEKGCMISYGWRV